MKKLLATLSFLLIVLMAACSSSPSQLTAKDFKNAADTSDTRATADPKAGLSDLNRDQLKTYSSTFVVKFEGAKPWTYNLKTRKSPSFREISLHIDGLSQKENPGDVRLVTEGTTSRMIGAGTDNECIQFEVDQGMDPKWIYPESLVSNEDLSKLVKYAGDEKVSGVDTYHYSVSGVSVGAWKEVSIDVWQEKISKTLLKYTLQAAGDDPFFKTGAGKINATYSVAGLDVSKIEAIKGCEISVPVPDTAKNFVRLPGMASFDSSASLTDVLNFYQSKLPADKWTEAEAPAQSDGATVVTFKRNADEVQIQIQIQDNGANGSSVKLIFNKAQ